MSAAVVYVPDVEAAVRMGLAELLRSNGRLTVRTGESFAAQSEEVAADVGDADVVCAALGRVNAAAMDAAPSLRLVVKCGIGVDNIDVAAAAERGITVARAAGVNFKGVAEFVIGSTIAALRRFRQLNAAVREHRWQEVRTQWSGLLPALTGRTIGVVGLGAIGRETARLARAHGMRVLAHDPYVGAAPAEAAGARLVELPDLLRDADVVSLHVLLTPETRHLIGARELAAMKSDALLVNSARGPVVDERALADALRDGAIGGAVVDVLELEPPLEDNPLLALDNCHLTPHLAGCTDYGYREIGALAADLVLRFVDGRPLPESCVVVSGRELAGTA